MKFALLALTVCVRKENEKTKKWCFSHIYMYFNYLTRCLNFLPQNPIGLVGNIEQ